MIEEMECSETVRIVLRMRDRHGITFVEIAKTIGFSYQWVHKLHKVGVCLFNKHLTF